jgi:spore coat protein U-like protein
MFRIAKLAAALAVLVPCAALAGPSPQTATFTVKATVVKGCTVAAGALDLGAYDPTSASDLAPATGSTIAVTCTKNTNITVAPLTTTNTFKMKSTSVPAEALTYKLYQDAAHTKDWSTVNATGSSTTVTAPVNFSVYGVVAKGQDAAALNDYSDTVNVSVTFN